MSPILRYSFFNNYKNTKKLFDVLYNELIKDKDNFTRILKFKDPFHLFNRNYFDRVSNNIGYDVNENYKSYDIESICLNNYIFFKIYNDFKEYFAENNYLSYVIRTDDVERLKYYLTSGKVPSRWFTILSVISLSDSILELFLKLKITDENDIKDLAKKSILNPNYYVYFDDSIKMRNFITKYTGAENLYKYLLDRNYVQEADILYENNKKLLDDFFLENNKKIISCLKKDYTNEFVDLILKDVQNLNNTDYKSLEDFIIGKLIDQNYYESKKILFVKGNLDKYFFEDNNNQYVLLRNIITELLSGKDIIYKIILEAKKLKLNDNNLNKIEEFIKIYNIPLEKKELDLINQDFKYNFKFKKILKFLESICNS